MSVRGAQAPAKRSLGQNFLTDANIARKIVDSLGIRPGDPVLEIGPGRGALTRHILEREPGALAIIEKDDALAEALLAEHGGISLAGRDALEFDWAGLAPDAGWRIVGNLPYNVASPIIWDIVSQARYAAAVFMVQLEVGQRLAAAPGGKDYGALSVWVQSHAQVELLFKVPPQVFIPRPKITSAVMRFCRKNVAPAPEAAIALSRTLRMCFQQRRKQLGNILKSNGIDAHDRVLEGLGLDPARRPETLAPETFQALGNAIKSYFGS